MFSINFRYLSPEGSGPSVPVHSFHKLINTYPASAPGGTLVGTERNLESPACTELAPQQEKAYSKLAKLSMYRKIWGSAVGHGKTESRESRSAASSEESGLQVSVALSEHRPAGIPLS